MRVNCYAVSQHRQKGGESGTDSQATAGKGVGANPCDACASDRGNTQRVPGVKGSLLVEGDGYRVGTLANPLATCIAGANINDHLLLAATLDAVVVERPKPTEGKPQHLCLDKGFDNAPTREVVKERGYEEHIKRIGEEKKDGQGDKTHPARRWVVERTIGWLSRWRGILNRWERA